MSGTRRRREARGHARYPRTARVNELVRQVLADEIARLADVDERLKLVTITDVSVSNDLARADVFLSTAPVRIRASLEEHRLDLQAALARQVRLKRTPQLVFGKDPAVAAGERVERILRRSSRRDSPRDS
ncbi:MAG: ribosome-binding factor A [Actinomycetota bacterium]|nr:ribosome-binding factor A [Actinomycetota bacterium]